MKTVNEFKDKLDKIKINLESFFNLVQVKQRRQSSNVIVLGFSDYSWVEPSGLCLDKQLELMTDYDEWYNEASVLIKESLSDRYSDFLTNYTENLRIIKLEEEIWSNDTSKIKNKFTRNLLAQNSLLESALKMLSNKVTQNPEHKSESDNTKINLSNNELLLYDIKTHLAVLSSQISRLEFDLKTIGIKVEGIGNITINNMNQNSAQTGAITIKNKNDIENVIKWMQPELNNELEQFKAQIEKKGDSTEKTTLLSLVSDIIGNNNPTAEWLQEKIKGIQYWSDKTGIAVDGIKKFLPFLGLF